MWRNERIGFVMIVASLLVMGVVVLISFNYQLDSRLEQVRIQGIGLARVLGGMSWEELVPKQDGPGILQAVRHGQSNPDFAYGILIDSEGKPISEVSLPGVIIPNKSIPNKPTAWLGERTINSAGSNGTFLEFHAPVFSDRNLKGYIRLGYIQPQFRLPYEDLPFFATLALPVFLLMTLFYFLLRHEIRPLREMSINLDRIVKGESISKIELQPSGELGNFIERFTQFANESQNRIKNLKDEQSGLLTSSKLLSYKQSRIESILQTLPDAILVFDESGIATYANDKISNLMGVEKNDVIGKKPTEWCSNQNVISYLSRHNAKSSQIGYISDSIQIASKKDPDKILEVKTFPLFSPKNDNNLLGNMLVIKDCTEEQLAKSRRGEFVAQVAHELKTPLNVLAMYSESLLGEDGDSEAFRVDAVNVIHDEVERLSTLINNMLALTKFDMGGMQLNRNRVRLHELLEDAFNNISQSGRGKDLVFELDLPKEISAVYVDKDLFRIAINNLLTNAIKYNRPAGKVTVSAEEMNGAIEIRVQDTGIGISPKDQQHIFEKFFRSNDESVREQTGHGLGLPLAQKIIQLHHSSLKLESEYNKGTTFIIRLDKEIGSAIQEGAA
ncbi:MAG: PAS domain S-box protein [Candidatus Thiodiazotropha sp. (ex Cardiolucina cf. quadrata)]|nr:PAS domain S-box protein [Candidatus Thiodiazotropha sp. (ex Cardiolucina cf. quadrata)]